MTGVSSMLSSPTSCSCSCSRSPLPVCRSPCPIWPILSSLSSLRTPLSLLPRRSERCLLVVGAAPSATGLMLTDDEVLAIVLVLSFTDLDRSRDCLVRNLGSFGPWCAPDAGVGGDVVCDVLDDLLLALLALLDDAMNAVDDVRWRRRTGFRRCARP